MVESGLSSLWGAAVAWLQVAWLQDFQPASIASCHLFCACPRPRDARPALRVCLQCPCTTGLQSVARKKGPHEHALPPMTERLRGLISSSHFEKLVDRDLCSSRVPKAACCRSRVCQCMPQRSLPAGASLVCRFFRSCLSGRCSVTVRAPWCTRAAACMLFRVVAMRCRFAGDRHVPDLVDLVAVVTTTGFWIPDF